MSEGRLGEDRRVSSCVACWDVDDGRQTNRGLRISTLMATARLNGSVENNLAENV